MIFQRNIWQQRENESKKALKAYKAILWKKKDQLATLVNKAGMRCN